MRTGSLLVAIAIIGLCIDSPQIVLAAPPTDLPINSRQIQASTETFQDYAKTIQRGIRRYQIRSSRWENARQPIIEICLTKSGLVLFAQAKGTGFDTLDRSYEDAVYAASPFVQCPDITETRTLTIVISGGMQDLQGQTEVLNITKVNEKLLDADFDFSKVFSLLDQGNLRSADEYFHTELLRSAIKFAIAKSVWMNFKYASLTGHTHKFSDAIKKLADLQKNCNYQTNLSLLVDKICAAITADAKDKQQTPKSLIDCESNKVIGRLLKSVIELLTEQDQPTSRLN